MPPSTSFGRRRSSSYIAFMKVNLKGINTTRKILADGTEIVYVYAWKGGPRIYAPLDTQEFLAEYNECLKQKVEKPKNLANLLDEYTRSTKFNKNKKTTIRRTLVSIKKVKATLGEMPVSVFNDPDVVDVLESWRDKVIVEISPADAEHQWNSLSGALTWAAERIIIKRNPCKGHYVSLIGSRVDKIWSDEQVEQYIRLAPSNMVVALMLGLWTGQREGSLVNLRWSDYDGNILTVVQGKNRAGTPPKIVKIPVSGEFKTFMDDLERTAGVVGLSQQERSQPAILLNALGREWKFLHDVWPHDPRSGWD
jgi:integrase